MKIMGEISATIWIGSNTAILWRSSRYKMANRSNRIRSFQRMMPTTFQQQHTVVIAQMQGQQKYQKDKVKSKFQQAQKKEVNHLSSWSLRSPHKFIKQNRERNGNWARK